MIFGLFPRDRQEPTIRALYGAIVAQARAPAFYRGYAVPDTVNGRFDMIVLHLTLVLDRMEAEPEPVRELGQAVFDLFCREMDGHFREEGISDLKVPKEMRQMGEAFYGRRTVYRDALAAPGNDALEAALTRNIYRAQPGAKADAVRLAAYVRAAVDSLSRLKGLDNGRLAWPDPDAISIETTTRATQSGINR
jgi:cytochrome b pre-mRNA-processing protein 3